MTDPNPPARTRLAPAGLMFLAITSVGWGFNWPSTKFLLSELPPLTLRGATGVIGAVLLAAILDQVHGHLLIGQALEVEGDAHAVGSAGAPIAVEFQHCGFLAKRDLVGAASAAML